MPHGCWGNLLFLLDGGFSLKICPYVDLTLDSSEGQKVLVRRGGWS